MIVQIIIIALFIVTFIVLNGIAKAKRKKEVKQFIQRREEKARNREQAREERVVEGEKCLFGSLCRARLAEEFVLTNLTIPMDDGKTTVIHTLVIVKCGVFVFECLNYYGVIDGEKDEKIWFQQSSPYCSNYEKKEFYNPIMQNDMHMRALQKYLEHSGMKVPPIRGYLSFPKELKKTPRTAQIYNGHRYVTHDGAGKTMHLDSQLNCYMDALTNKEIYDLAKFLRDTCCHVQKKEAKVESK